jgi:hypothetical protein
MKRFLPLWLSVVSLGAVAQTATIKKVELAGDKVIVYFDLEDSNSSNEYLLNLYASKDNFVAPLTKVKGDIGPEVKPGTGKKVEWSIMEEYGAYRGRISLELRGKVYVAFAKFRNFDPAKSYKRGKQYDIFWKAGSTNPVNVELYKGTQRVQSETNRPNNGDYLLTIPASAKTGKDYRLKLTDTKNTDDSIFTPYFKVVPKIPTALKAAGALLLIGGGVAAASGGSKPDTGGGNNPADGVIVAPDLP